MRCPRKRVRCVRCQSLRTRRHGNFATGKGTRHRKRWYCCDCGHTFSPRRQQVTDETVRLYFDLCASYRDIGRYLHMRPMTAYQKVIHMGLMSKSPLQVSQELKPNWPGYLIVDGDSIRVAHHKEHLLLGVDSHSQDIPHALLVKSEDGKNWTRLFRQVKQQLGLIPQGIVSDGDPAVLLARDSVYPKLPKQICVRHFHQDLTLLLRYRFTQKPGHWRQIDRFLEDVHWLLYAKSYPAAQQMLLAICADPGYPKADLSHAIDILVERFPQLVTHHFHPGMPRTTNIAEGVISRLDERIEPADGFGSHQTCWATLKLLITWYRFKRFTDCGKKNKHKNGKSSLELAGVNIAKINWIRFSQKNH